jgi:hypothetical protein
LVSVELHWSSWKAADGAIISVRAGDLVLRALAAQYLNDQLKNAQVRSREPLKNWAKQIIGERIVALLLVPADPSKKGPSDAHKYLPAVIQTHGTFYFEATSDSLDDALAFETYAEKKLPLEIARP